MQRRALVPFLALAAVPAACTLFSTPRLPPAPPPRFGTYSRAEVAQDLDSLFAMYERVHPDLYAVTSRESLARARAALVASLADSVSRDAAYLRFARIVALIGDGHTGISGGDQRGYLARGGRVFPIRVDLDAASVIRISNATGGFPTGMTRGDRLVSVNGLDADSLVREFTLETSGETVAWRGRLAAQGFAGSLRLHRVDPPFRVTIADSSGARHTLILSGLGRAELDSINAIARTTVAAQPQSDPNFTYRRLDDGNGYIDFYSMAGDAKSFRSRIAAAFAQIARDSVRSLIIDLRRNGGGDSELGVAILSHFVDKPYRTESFKEMRSSEEYRAYVRSGINPNLRWLHVEYFVPEGRRYFRAPVGSKVMFSETPEMHDIAEPRFVGPVCVLIGSGTFSSAMEIADGIKTYRLATTLGEDTGGLPTAFGEVYTFRLPITGMVASTSTSRYVRASGDTTDHGPVRPDIEIKRTAEDIRLGRDPVLDRARHCAELHQ